MVPYRDGIALQEEHVRARAAGEIADTLLLLEHPPVLTAGRGTGDGSVIADAATLERLGLEVVPVSRGGDVTWHGPGSSSAIRSAISPRTVTICTASCAASSRDSSIR
jgi:lipoyl(octanoyl) transferase